MSEPAVGHPSSPEQRAIDAAGLRDHVIYDPGLTLADIGHVLLAVCAITGTVAFMAVGATFCAVKLVDLAERVQVLLR
jgi:hypothetical protein